MDAILDDFGLGRGPAAGNIKNANTIILGRSLSVRSAKSPISPIPSRSSSSVSGKSLRRSGTSGSDRSIRGNSGSINGQTWQLSTPPIIPSSSKRTSSLHRSEPRSVMTGGPSTPPIRPQRRLQPVNVKPTSNLEDDEQQWRSDPFAKAPVSPVSMSRMSMDTFGEGSEGVSTIARGSQSPSQHIDSVFGAPSGSASDASESTPQRRRVRISTESQDGSAESYNESAQHITDGNNTSEGVGQEEDVQKTPTMADAAIRSAPGVVGLGEGWAGGPQQRSSSSWWKRRKPADDTADPLALWSSRTGDGPSQPVSPVKALWNRSVQRFGGSMPHLPMAESPTKKRSMESSAIRQTVSVPQKLSTPSQPIYRAQSKSSFALSTPHLAAPILITQEPAQRDSVISTNPSVVPTAPVSDSQSSSSRTRRSQGPRPPWRPTSTIGASGSAPVRSPRPQAIYEVPETPTIAVHTLGKPTVNSAARPLTPPASKHSAPLQRTDTFGAGGTAASAYAVPTAQEEQSLEEAKAIRERYRMSTAGFDTLDDWSKETKPIPEAPTRRLALFHRIRAALTSPRLGTRPTFSPSPSRLFARSPSPSPSRSATPSSAGTKLPLFSRSTSDPADLVLRDTEKEESGEPALVRRSKSSAGLRRRRSWLGGGDGWAKRLSRLTEQEEDETAADCNDDAAIKSSRRNSFIFRVRPSRSASTTSFEPAEMDPTSARSLTTLTRMSTTDLDLHLDLPETGLGLDDILSDHKRQSILDSYDLDVVFSFPAPPTTTHTPHTPRLGAPVSVSSNPRLTHSRVISVPTTISSNSSGSGSSTFPETPRMTVFERSYPHNPLLRHQKSEGSFVSRDDMSFYSARERQESTVDEERFRLTLDTAETRGSDVSAIGFVIEEAKVHSFGGRHPANTVTMDEVRREAPASRVVDPSARV